MTVTIGRRELLAALGGAAGDRFWTHLRHGMIQDFRSAHLPHCPPFRPTFFPVLMA